MFEGYYGARNNYYLFSRYGIFTAQQTALYQNLKSLGMDASERVFLNRGYAQLAKDWLTVRAGKQIVAWARAYAYNPTDKINTPNLLDPTKLNNGVMALTYDFRIFEDFVNNRAMFITGYFKLTDKLAKNIPFGIKTRFNISEFEFALSYLYEVKEDPFSSDGMRRKSYLGFDFFIQFAGIGLYLESTYRFEQKKDRDFQDQLIAVFGFSTTFSFKMSLRIEYIYYGPGKADKKDYQAQRLIAMVDDFLAEHYAFIMIDGDASRIVWLGLSGIINFNDFSFTLIPQIKLAVIENVKIEIGSFIFFGKANTEYNGRFTVIDNATLLPKKIDFTETQGYVRLKVSF
jgi:hypothetical protein